MLWSWCVLVIGARVAAGASLTSRAGGGEGSPCSWRRASAGEELACTLRTAGGASELLAALGDAQAQRVTALDLRCTDVLFFESSLDVGRRGSDGLSRFHNLRQLRLDSCKIRYVPAAALAALPGLRDLSLRTHNTDWSAMSMEVHRDAFRGLSELRTLDLADNNIWVLPSEVFCPLHALKELNATRNRLQDISSLGFSDWGGGPTAPGKSCNSALETLDLSHNQLRALPDNVLSSLRALRRLLLQHNRIANLADRAFVGLADLQLLNLSSNSLQALPPETFQSSRDIRQVYLHNNSLSVLAPGLLEGLDQLQILDLSANLLTSEWVNRDTFSGLVRLIVLNLSDNRISKVDAQLFQDLNNLQFLSLERNRISRLAESAFANLNNLHSLSLAHNEIIQVDVNHFSNLYVLNQLFLDGNKISKIDPRSFENITKLRDLGVSGNLLPEVPEAIKTLRFLTSLDLGTNKITKVSNSQFEGLDDLYGLRLVGNKIQKISKDTFAPLSSLQILNLASNSIDRIDAGAFSSSGQLRALGLDGNRLTDLQGALSASPALAWLNVSANQLLRFDYSHIPPSLQWLDLSKNLLEHLLDEHGARAASGLKLVDLSYNRLSLVDEFTLPDLIETALLDHNQIASVHPGAFLGKPALGKVVLYGNQLRGIEEAALLASTTAGEIYLGDNPLVCDCNLEWMSRVARAPPADPRPRLRVADMDDLVCGLPHARGASHERLIRVRPEQFLCSYDSHCFALCHCCDFDACDCEMTCPDKCSCYRDLTWNTNVVDCSRAGYDRVPERIPMDATEIYLDGNDLKELGNHVFLGKKRLQVLYLNNSNVAVIDNKTFYGIESLQELRLERNNLSELKKVHFAHLPNLARLDLEGNAISTLENNTFEALRSLESLNMDGNGRAQYLPWELGFIARTSVTFRDVTWRCDCGHAVRLERWFTERQLDTTRIRCHSADCMPSNTSVASAATRCRASIVDVPRGGAESRLAVPAAAAGADAVPIVAAALAAAALLLLAGALLALFREDLELWLHARHGVRLRAHEARDRDSGKLFDALVTYNPCDSELVTRALAADLEAGGHALCLQHRDLPPAERRAPVALAAAAGRARRLLVVLSTAFLQREWSAPERRAAVQAALGAMRARRRVVFLVTTDLSAVRVDAELRALLKTCSVVVWGERRCRARLHLLLPEPSAPSKPASPPRAALRYTAPPSAAAWASPPHSRAGSADVSRSTEDDTCSAASSECGGACARHSYACIQPPAPLRPHPPHPRHHTYFV